MIYLDNGATSLPKPNAVIRAMSWAAGHLASPGRGSSAASEQADELLYNLRMTAGEMFECDPQNVVLTTSATHGLNIAIKSIVRTGDRVVISGMEHNAVLRPLHALGADIQVAKGSLFDDQALLQDFDRLLTKDTAACVTTHISNVFGWVLPIGEIAALCRDRGIPLILDAAQSAGSIPVSMETLKAAFIAMPGHKGLLGPQGTGLLLCNHEVIPLMEGGTGSVSALRDMPDFLPDRLEAGTQNIPGAAGLLAGLQFVRTAGIEQIQEKETALRDLMIARLGRIPNVQVFHGDRQSGVVSFRVKDRDSVLLGEALAKNDIALRAGLHCAPLAHETAGTQTTGTIRASVGPFSAPGDIRSLSMSLSRLLEKS